MTTPDDDASISRSMFVMQLIAGAILAGLVGFTILVLVIDKNPNRDNPPLVTYIAAGMFAIMLPLALLIPRMVLQSGVQRVIAGTWRPPAESDPAAFSSDAARFLAVRQTAMIVRLAMLEGPGFLACIAYLIEAVPYVLAIPALTALIMVARFPTPGGVRAWLEEQVRAKNEAAL